MNYEDFPILSNADYSLLKRELSAPKQEREKAIEIILALLCSFSNCTLTTKKLNTKILNSLNKAKHVCLKLQSNFTSLFNIATSHNEVESLNLFSMIKKLLLASTELSSLAENEDKIYYKKIFLTSAKELVLSSTDIVSALQDSCILTFNHM